jgi:omega-6 fatty acid desaturase (delta-12 desaturase)
LNQLDNDGVGRRAPLTSREWSRMAVPYATPDPRRSLLQLANTVVSAAGIWFMMSLFVNDAYWATLLLSLPAAALVVRLFMIQHDCGHRSYFRSAKLNEWVGHAIGVLTLTPHGYWRRAHNIHHASSGNLDKRGIGDVTTLTVSEYRDLPWLKRFAYRVYRHPLTVLGIGPIYLFVIKFRLPLDLLRQNPRQRASMLASVMVTNMAIAALLVGVGLWIGFIDMLLLQAPIVLLSSAAGVWLFYMQHQFEHVYWRRGDDWEFHDAAVAGSSFYDLPQPLRWITADIGIHHVHHLSSRIPNYRLRECMARLPDLPSVTRLTLWDSMKCLRLGLYDETAGRMISFSSLRGDISETRRRAWTPFRLPNWYSDGS